MNAPLTTAAGPAAVPVRLSGLTVAVSREVGARGGSIAGRVGRKLGWPVYNQELLEYLAQEGSGRETLLADLPEPARDWAEARFEELLAGGRVTGDAGMMELVRLTLLLAAQGEVVMVGRGAGYVLPAPNVLHVRVVAPAEDRVAYMGQRLRLSRDEAAAHVRRAESKRAAFLSEHFAAPTTDPAAFDLVVNSSLLGEEGCAELIAFAVRCKLEAREQQAEGGAEFLA